MIERGETLVNVIQGEYRISDDPNCILSTVLGSCAAVCLTDPTAQVGGMNHFLLPHRAGPLRPAGPARRLDLAAGPSPLFQ